MLLPKENKNKIKYNLSKMYRNPEQKKRNIYDWNMDLKCKIGS